ncbi:hypothetical protein BH11PLA1_BH11PLA1_20810 [soil metagenome]
MTTTLSHLLRLSLLAAALVFAGAPSARAQSLPPALVTKATLTDAEKATVEQWLTPQLAKLSSDDPLVIKAGRDSILQPLRSGGKAVSVQFRTEMNRVAAPLLGPMVADKRELVAANALRVAGEIAYGNLTATLLSGLADARPGVQYAALFGIRQTFDASAPGPGGAAPVASITPQNVIMLMQGLQTLGSTTTDPRLLDGGILALEGAIGVPNSTLPGTRQKAISTLAALVSAQVRLVVKDPKASAAMLSPLQRAASTARSVLTTQTGDALTTQENQDLAAIGGQLLALAALAAGQDGIDAEALISLVQTSENVIYLTGINLSSRVEDLRLAEGLRSGGAASLRAAVLILVGPDGRLTQAPFSIAAARFKLVP